jgi:hypothetical protein
VLNPVRHDDRLIEFEVEVVPAVAAQHHFFVVLMQDL